MNEMSAIAPVAIAADGRARFTAIEFAGLVTAGAMQDIRLELIDGELARMTPPMSDHSNRQTSVTGQLWRLFGDRVAVEIGIEIGQDSVLVCDIALLTAAATGMRFLRPDEVALVVEVSQSTFARDMDVKRAKYAAAGIATYWVIDGQRSVVHVCSEPVNGDYAQIATVRFGEPLAVPGTDATIVVE